MTRLLRTLVLVIAAAALAPENGAAQKKVLDHSVYETWDTIGGAALSRDGQWALYHRLRYDRDGALVVRAVSGATSHVFDRGTGASFDGSARFVVFTIRAARDSVLAARRARRRPDQMPRDTMAILELGTGRVTKIPAVRGITVPDESRNGWIAYQLERAGGSTGNAQNNQASNTPRRTKEAGTPLVLRDLASGNERRIDDVASFAFSRDGSRLAFAISNPDSVPDGVHVMDVASGNTTEVMRGEGEYRRLVFDRAGEQLAFLANTEEWRDPSVAAPAYALYHWRPRIESARRVVASNTNGMRDGWVVSENGAVSFSESGNRILLGTAPRPEPEVTDSLLAEERVRVDVWHWQDAAIQPAQLRRVQQERRRTYQAIVHLQDSRFVQLADDSLPDVNVGARGDADVAIGTNSGRYALESSWDTPGWSDYYLVDVRSGTRTLVRERAQGNMSLSPVARYATWFDNVTRSWKAMDVRTRRIVDMTASIPHAVHDEMNDSPTPPGSYGSAGWLAGEEAFLVHDDFDIWAVDPTGRAAPRSFTSGYGRAAGLRLRLVRLDRDAQYVDPAGLILMSAFEPATKRAGFFSLTPARGVRPLVLAPFRFSTPQKAEDADVLLFTKQSFTDFPDLWTSSLALADMRQLTHENPQQAEYNWGTAELVEWTSLDGMPLQGILYKPENFDPSKKYPLISYFYERMSDDFHLHYAPVPHRSRINFTFYTSRGYLVFVPDIAYRIGYPGESAMNSIMPGVMKLMERPYVDRENLALQGHSWGGYQIAFMVTRTNLFEAAIAGAPVANMTSAYGGIRWESGLARQFQYERTQSRIGATLWDAPMQYIENSPLFWLQKVETPLLIMHNDQDGAVPWEQGIELYLGLRRLGKPTWLVNYNDEPHWPTTPANKRDWNIRMQQFFDHYLQDAPAAPWIREGVPATKKGRTLGY